MVESLLKGLNCIDKTTVGNILVAHIYGERITPPGNVTVDRLNLQDFFINIVRGKSNV
jgi:hypothetical protein